MKRVLWILLACMLVFTGCKTRAKRNLLPNVSGKAGEVLVVIERADWEADLGVAIREALAGDTPYLAQREPLFALSNVPAGSFTNMFKVHRNLLLININPQNATNGVVYKNNVWAQPQALVQVNAADVAQALSLFKEAAPLIAEFFEQSERDRIIANSKLYEERALQAPVEKVTGGILHFPTGYRCRKYTDDFVWIADEKQYTNQTVLVYKYPVEGPDVFTLDRPGVQVSCRRSRRIHAGEYHRRPQCHHEGQCSRSGRGLLHDHQYGSGSRYPQPALSWTRFYGDPRFLGSRGRFHGRSLRKPLLLQPRRQGYHRAGSLCLRSPL